MCTQKSPYALHPASQKFPQWCLWDVSIVRLIDNGPLSSFQEMPLSSWWSMVWCPWLCACWQCLNLPNTSDLPRSKPLVRLLCPPVYVLGCFPSLQHVQGSTPPGVFKDRCRPSTYSSLGFPFHLSLFVVDDGMCGLTVTSWSNPAEVMGDCFHLQCLWRSSCTREYCTVFDELDLVHCVLVSTL